MKGGEILTENLKALLAKVAQDQTLQSRFNACKSVPEQVVLAKELGFEITQSEFEESTKLSDDQLDEVAGGFGDVVVPCIVHFN